MINSCIYTGTVIHKRFKPKEHFFKYKVFSLFIDLSELETLSDKIFELCFSDSRVLSVWMKLEKLDVFSEAKSVGIEICRDKTNYQNIKKKKSNITKIKK